MSLCLILFFQIIKILNEIFCRAATFEKIPVPAKLCADPGFSGPNRDIVMIATGSNLPHFYKGEYNNEDTDAFSTQFNTTLAGSLIAIHGLNATSNEILLPSV